MHLVDRVLTENIVRQHRPRAGWDDLGYQMPPIRVVAHDVARYFAWSGQRERNIQEDFGCLRLPFPSLWVEYEWPKWRYMWTDTSQSKLAWRRDDEHAESGALIESGNPDKDGRLSFMMTHFFRTNRSVMQLPFNSWVVISSAGVGIELEHFGSAGFLEYEGHDDLATASAVVPLLAISLMHCKNVAQEMVEPNPKLSKKWARKRGKPLSKISRIVLPAMHVPGDDPRGENSQWRQPLHMVRGHFKTYSNDRPLMGRNVGTYWWPPHVRGSKAYGVRIPEYEIQHESEAVRSSLSSESTPLERSCGV